MAQAQAAQRHQLSSKPPRVESCVALRATAALTPTPIARAQAAPACACRRESKSHQPACLLLFLSALPSSARSGVLACQGLPRDVLVQNERPVAGGGGVGSLYLSCSYLMYTHLLYLLPNKRNTSVLPTETARELAHWSPRAPRCSLVLRAGHSGTPAPSEALAYKHMGVCRGCWRCPQFVPGGW